MAESSGFTPVVENYLKQLYLLGEQGKGPVSTTALAGALEVSPASVTSMFRKLAEQGLLAHEPYRGAQLTAAGQRAALEILRHHRLLELFLHRLGMLLDEVHEEAELLEHAVSERLESYLAAWLGDPAYDPHGDPIPTLAGEVPQRSECRLTSLKAGDHALISRVPHRDAQQLRALIDAGLEPEAEVELLAADTALGTVQLAVTSPLSVSRTATVTLSLAVAADVMVRVSPPEPER
ncbi:metal-dependent transcriptional regulator [Deinococcus sp. Marseille-Q6407]|uniref:metal-dependent transcriptional regulator n=1 Tax=Deinococcus sp. Marseille-Q6407 TaxID=2969223 RepID=UPI0021C0D4E7|nr:metal-dependent transcriptional regulator [Deinococcus sp. Marseille-Q6407]